MAESISSVEVTCLDEYPALKMSWQHKVNKSDLSPAFQKITQCLHQSNQPLYIIVDLSEDPQFPIVDTMMGALRGPFRHPRLAEWLVVGSNRAGKTIGDLLIKTTQRNNIRWFDSEAEALAYLESLACLSA